MPGARSCTSRSPRCPRGHHNRQPSSQARSPPPRRQRLRSRSKRRSRRREHRWSRSRRRQPRHQGRARSASSSLQDSRSSFGGGARSPSSDPLSRDGRHPAELGHVGSPTQRAMVWASSSDRRIVSSSRQVRERPSRARCGRIPLLRGEMRGCRAKLCPSERRRPMQSNCSAMKARCARADVGKARRSGCPEEVCQVCGGILRCSEGKLRCLVVVPRKSVAVLRRHLPELRWSVATRCRHVATLGEQGVSFGEDLAAHGGSPEMACEPRLLRRM